MILYHLISNRHSASLSELLVYNERLPDMSRDESHVVLSLRPELHTLSSVSFIRPRRRVVAVFWPPPDCQPFVSRNASLSCVLGLISHVYGLLALLFIVDCERVGLGHRLDVDLVRTECVLDSARRIFER